ncbi:MAG: CotH kinase family protein [Cyclobacteriaceae bacterium]|jgi:hypothetical protein
MRFCCAALLIFTLAAPAFSQPVDHWETVVYDSMFWRFRPGTSDPGANWFTPSFSDNSWAQGRGGFGYGDGDDRTTISPVMSVFLRRKFSISNRSKIVKVVLHVDYDDGFIAYLNGTELVRGTMPAGPVGFNQSSAGFHEAQLYQGIAPAGYELTESQLALLVQGENTLAVQVHNENIGSSDLTARVFLSVGVSDASFTYLPTPDWFVPPLSFQSSNLPIISINTNGQTIQDENRIVADMGIIDNGVGQPNRISDPFNTYEGKISIEIRGESSQMFPKKSYRVETVDANGNPINVALLGMPAENDWVLYAPYTDKTMLRDVLAYDLGRALGSYAPRTRFAEVVLNGEYMGVYVLIEKIKRDRNRVAIAELEPGDLAGDALTGGYILRVDKWDGNDYPAWTATPTPQLPGEEDKRFQYHDPKGGDMAETQRTYIREYIRQFQSALTSTGFSNPATGFMRLLDVPDAVNFILINEIGKNIDAYVFSTYLYKERDSRGGKLHLGPLWDFNLAFGNVNYLANAQFAPGWMWNDQYRMYWFRRMVQAPMFAAELKCRWQSLRGGFFTDQYMVAKIDSLTSLLTEAQVRNYQRWPILGTYVWPNQFIGDTYEQEVNFLKNWLLTRLAYMDAEMPGDCGLITSVADEPGGGTVVWPNPFSTEVHVEHLVDAVQLDVLDSYGRLVGSMPLPAGGPWDGSRLASGVYVARVRYADGRMAYQRLVKQ